MTPSHPVAIHVHFQTGVACHNRNIPVAHRMWVILLGVDAEL